MWQWWDNVNYQTGVALLMYFKAKSWVEKLLRVESNVTVVATCIVTYIRNKPLLVVEHAFPLIGFVGLSAHATIYYF